MNLEDMDAGRDSEQTEFQDLMDLIGSAEDDAETSTATSAEVTVTDTGADVPIDGNTVDPDHIDEQEGVGGDNCHVNVKNSNEDISINNDSVTTAQEGAGSSDTPFSSSSLDESSAVGMDGNDTTASTTPSSTNNVISVSAMASTSLLDLHADDHATTESRTKNTDGNVPNSDGITATIPASQSQSEQMQDNSKINSGAISATSTVEDKYDEPKELNHEPCDDSIIDMAHPEVDDSISDATSSTEDQISPKPIQHQSSANNAQILKEDPTSSSKEDQVASTEDGAAASMTTTTATATSAQTKDPNANPTTKSTQQPLQPTPNPQNTSSVGSNSEIDDDDDDDDEKIAAQMAAVAVAAAAQASESPAAAANYAKNLSATIVHLPPNASGAGNRGLLHKKRGIPTPVHTVLVQKYIRKEILEQDTMQDFLSGSGSDGAGQSDDNAEGTEGMGKDEGKGIEMEVKFESETDLDEDPNSTTNADAITTDVALLLRQHLARGSNTSFVKHLLMVNHFEFIDLKFSSEKDPDGTGNSGGIHSPPASPGRRGSDGDENRDHDITHDLSNRSFSPQEEEVASKAATQVLKTLQQAEDSYNYFLGLIPSNSKTNKDINASDYMGIDDLGIGSSDGGSEERYDYDAISSLKYSKRSPIPDLLPSYPTKEGDATNVFFKACAPIIEEEEDGDDDEGQVEEEGIEMSIGKSESMEVNVGVSVSVTSSPASGGSSKESKRVEEDGGGGRESTKVGKGSNSDGSGGEGKKAKSPEKKSNDDPPPTLARNLASSFMGSVFSSVNRRRSRKRTEENNTNSNINNSAATSSVASTANNDDASVSASSRSSTTAPPSPPRVEQNVRIGVDYNVTIVREMLGLTVENVLERTVVRTVLPNGAAKKAGTKVGSLVVKVGTVETKNLTHFETIDELRQSQRPLKLVLRRIGKDSLRGAREEMGRLIKGGGFGICSSEHPGPDNHQLKNGENRYVDAHLTFLQQRWMEITKRKILSASTALTKRDEVLSKVGARLAWILSLLVVGLEREVMNLKATIDDEGSYSSHYSDHSVKDFEDAARSVSKILHDYVYKHFERSGETKQNTSTSSMKPPVNAAVAKRKKQTAPPEHIQHEQRKAIPGATKRSVQQKPRGHGQHSTSFAEMALSQIGDVLHRARSFLADHNSPPAALLRGEVIALLCDVLDLDSDMTLSEALTTSDSGNSGVVNDLGSAGNLLKLIVLHYSNANLVSDVSNVSHTGNRFLAVVHRLAASRSTSARVTACSLGPVLWGHLDFPHQLQLRGVITRALHDVEVVVRKSTATVLHEIAELVFDSRAVPWLVLMCERAMTDPEPQLRAAAMTLTWHLAEHLPNAFLGDASEGSRSIQRLPSRSDPKFTEVHLLQCKLWPVATRLAEDSAGSVRLAVAAQCDRLAGALGEHWNSVIIDLLQELLGDQDHKVRGEAVMCIPRLAESVLSAESNIAGQDLSVLESLLPVALKLQKDTIDVRMCLAAASGELLSFLVWLYHHTEESSVTNDSGHDGPIQKKYIDDTLIPLLQALLHDPEPEVTSAALRAVTNASRGHARESSSRFEDDSVSLSSHQSHLIEKRDPVFRPVLSEDQVLRLVPTLAKLSASSQWRVRQSAVEIVPALLGCTHELETRSEIAQLCVKLMGDSVDAVRKSAAECLCLGGSNLGSNKSDEADEWLSAVVMPHLEGCRDSTSSKQRLLSLKMVEMILINIARWDANVPILKEVNSSRSDPHKEPTLSLISRALELASTLSDDRVVNVRLNVGRTFGNVLSVLNDDDDLEFVISTLEAQIESEKSRDNGGDRDVLYFARKSIALAKERIRHLDDVSILK